MSQPDQSRRADYFESLGPSDRFPANPYATTPVANSAEDLVLPTGNERLFVVAPIKQIAIGDLWPLSPRLYHFILAMLIFKIFRATNQPSWAAAFLDQREITEAEIPDHWTNEFAETRRLATSLGFVHPKYVTVPAIGPRMSVELLMTTPDGRIQWTFHRLTSIDNSVRTDETRRGLFSRLMGDGSLVTCTAQPTHRTAPWQTITKVRSKSFAKLLDVHRRKLAEHAVRPFDIHAIVEHSIAEDSRCFRDLIERGLLRDATAMEVIEMDGH